MLFTCFAWTQAIEQGVFVCPYFYKVVRRRGTKIHATCKVPHLAQRYFQNTGQCPQGWDKMAIEIAMKWVQIKGIDCGIFWNYSLLMLFFIEGEGVNTCRGGGDGLRWHKMTVRPANRWELLPTLEKEDTPTSIWRKLNQQNPCSKEMKRDIW